VPDHPAAENVVKRERAELESTVIRDAIAFQIKTLSQVVLDLVLSGHRSKSGDCTGFYISSNVKLTCPCATCTLSQLAREHQNKEMYYFSPRGFSINIAPIDDAIAAIKRQEHDL
jgi:hypothetical protein